MPMLHVIKQQTGDEVAGNYKKYVNAYEAAAYPFGKGVETDGDQHGPGSQAVNITAVPALFPSWCSNHWMIMSPILCEPMIQKRSGRMGDGGRMAG